MEKRRSKINGLVGTIEDEKHSVTCVGPQWDESGVDGS